MHSGPGKTTDLLNMFLHAFVKGNFFQIVNAKGFIFRQIIVSIDP